MKFKLVIVFVIIYCLAGGTISGISTNANLNIIRMAQEEDLDLREANVIDIEFNKPNEGIYEFYVTLYHDDDGEEGYADWWQVETLDGELLGRRELFHSHGTQPFTRSESIIIPQGVMIVVVRGHDQIHGYGGQALVVNLETGEVEKVNQGNELQNFSDYSDTRSTTSFSSVESFLTPGEPIVILLATLFLIIIPVLRLKRKS